MTGKYVKTWERKNGWRERRTERGIWNKWNLIKVTNKSSDVSWVCQLYGTALCSAPLSMGVSVRLITPPTTAAVSWQTACYLNPLFSSVPHSWVLLNHTQTFSIKHTHSLTYKTLKPKDTKESKISFLKAFHSHTPSVGWQKAVIKDDRHNVSPRGRFSDLYSQLSKRRINRWVHKVSLKGSNVSLIHD